LARAGGYRAPMIRLGRLLAAAGEGGDLSFDYRGSAATWPESPEVPAVVYVDEVTDAVKTVEDGVISGSLDRGQVWAVVGFKMSREVASKVEDSPMTPQTLIDAVRAAGFEWTAVKVSSS